MICVVFLISTGALALKLGRMAEADSAFVTLLGFNPDHNEYHYRLHAARGWTAPAGIDRGSLSLMLRSASSVAALVACAAASHT